MSLLGSRDPPSPDKCPAGSSPTAAQITAHRLFGCADQITAHAAHLGRKNLCTKYGHSISALS